MRINITSNTASVTQSLRQWQDSIKRDAMVQAVNRTAAKANTQIKRQISKSYALKYAEVGNALSIVRASRKGTAEVVAEVRVKGQKSRNVILFLERSVTLAEARRRRKSGTLNQLRFTIRRDRPRVMIPRTWVMTSNRGTFVAQRTGPGRRSIRSARTIDIPGMFKARRVSEAVVDKIRREFFPEEMLRGLRDASRRAGLA